MANFNFHFLALPLPLRAPAIFFGGCPSRRTEFSTALAVVAVDAVVALVLVPDLVPDLAPPLLVFLEGPLSFPESLLFLEALCLDALGPRFPKVAGSKGVSLSVLATFATI